MKKLLKNTWAVVVTVMAAFGFGIIVGTFAAGIERAYTFIAG